MAGKLQNTPSGVNLLLVMELTEFSGTGNFLVYNSCFANYVEIVGKKILTKPCNELHKTSNNAKKLPALYLLKRP